MTNEIFRINKRNFAEWKPEEVLRCPRCCIGKLEQKSTMSYKCSVCGRWFDEVK